MPDDRKQRRYHVSGIDELGDVHTFSTDDRIRADGVTQEDLEQGELLGSKHT